MKVIDEIKEAIKTTLVIVNPQSIDEFTIPKIIEILDKYDNTP